MVTVKSVVRGGGLKTRKKLYRSILYEKYMKRAAMGSRMGMAEQKVKAMQTILSTSW